MQQLASGTVAVLNGTVAIIAASTSLAAREQMGFMMRPDPTPAFLLFAFGIILAVNGLLLIFGVQVPMRPQGIGMLAYGGLMILVGSLMAATNVFPMNMSMTSAILMFLLGGLMIVSGAYMVSTAERPMALTMS